MEGVHTRDIALRRCVIGMQKGTCEDLKGQSKHEGNHERAEQHNKINSYSLATMAGRREEEGRNLQRETETSEVVVFQHLPMQMHRVTM